MKIKSSLKDWSYVVHRSRMFDNGVSLEARAIYAILKAFIGPNCSQPFPAQEQLADICDRDEDTVRKYVVELEQVGWISRKQRKGGRYSNTVYTLIEPPSRKRKKPHHTENIGTVEPIHHTENLGTKELPLPSPKKLAKYDAFAFDGSIPPKDSDGDMGAVAQWHLLHPCEPRPDNEDEGRPSLPDCGEPD